MEFRWNEWNVEHVGKHAVSPEQAEWVVRRASRPYPQGRGEREYYVRGADWGGRLLQVTYVLDPDDTIFVFHARPLTERECRQFRRRQL
jgi:uncharacterized DUF497 family protein